MQSGRKNMSANEPVNKARRIEIYPHRRRVARQLSRNSYQFYPITQFQNEQPTENKNHKFRIRIPNTFCLILCRRPATRSFSAVPYFLIKISFKFLKNSDRLYFCWGKTITLQNICELMKVAIWCKRICDRSFHRKFVPVKLLSWCTWGPI